MSTLTEVKAYFALFLDHHILTASAAPPNKGDYKFDDNWNITAWDRKDCTQPTMNTLQTYTLTNAKTSKIKIFVMRSNFWQSFKRLANLQAQRCLLSVQQMTDTDIANQIIAQMGTDMDNFSEDYGKMNF